MSGMWMWFSGRGVNQTYTTHVEGLEQIRKQAKREAIFAAIGTASAVFVIAFTLGDLRASWWDVVVVFSMVLVICALSLLAGLFWGRYFTWRGLSQAEVRMEVYNEDGPDPETGDR